MATVDWDAHCQQTGRTPETFWYMADKYIYDVDHAIRLVHDGREPVELDEESTRFSVDTSSMDWDRVPQVKTQYPGIIAHIWYRTEEGEMVHGHLLIDGHHRAARCLQLEQPFFVYLLTEEESEAVLLKSPLKRQLQETALAQA